jgi:hypothetical protein
MLKGMADQWNCGLGMVGQLRQLEAMAAMAIA